MLFTESISLKIFAKLIIKTASFKGKKTLKKNYRWNIGNNFLPILVLSTQTIKFLHTCMEMYLLIISSKDESCVNDHKVKWIIHIKIHCKKVNIIEIFTWQYLNNYVTLLLPDLCFKSFFLFAYNKNFCLKKKWYLLKRMSNVSIQDQRFIIFNLSGGKLFGL